MKTVFGIAFAVAFVASPAVAWECAGKKDVVATTSTSSAPVQTAEAPSTTQTK